MARVAGSRGVRAGLAALGLLLALSGCGVDFDAPKVTVLVRDDRIVYAGADDAEKFVGGETVLHIQNDGNQERQVVLARLGDVESVPAELEAAESPREDERILGMTHVLHAKEATFASGGFGYKVDSASFHVYLAEGERYVLFDRLGGLDSGVLIEIVPGTTA